MDAEWKTKGYVDHYNDIYCIPQKDIEDYVQRLNLIPSDCLVDFGCGNGDILFYISKVVKKAVGVDISSFQISQARSRLKNIKNIDLYNSSFLDCDISSYSFTKGSARKSLHHLTDDEKLTFIKNISPYFKANSLFQIEDAIFSFDKKELKKRMPKILEEAEKFYKEKWKNIKEDFIYCMLKEFPTDIYTWEKAFNIGGFEIIKKIHRSSFYGIIIARKV